MANGRWTLRVLYPDHAGIRETQDDCERYDPDFEIQSVHEIGPTRSRRYGLTDKQPEALQLACRRGYFAIPREVDLEGLADEFGVFDQAFSERVRRGIQTLVDDALLTEPLDDAVPAATSRRPETHALHRTYDGWRGDITAVRCLHSCDVDLGVNLNDNS